MKTLFTKIASFSLALLVLCSTFSFTVDKHYCGEFLVDVSFTGATEGCGMEMKSERQIKKKNCCKDETLKVEGQDELRTHKVENITFENQLFLTTFIVSYKDLLTNSESNSSFYKDFSPPDIPKNYQVLYQSFLI